MLLYLKGTLPSRSNFPTILELDVQGPLKMHLCIFDFSFHLGSRDSLFASISWNFLLKKDSRGWRTVGGLMKPGSSGKKRAIGLLLWIIGSWG